MQNYQFLPSQEPCGSTGLKICIFAQIVFKKEKLGALKLIFLINLRDWAEKNIIFFRKTQIKKTIFRPAVILIKRKGTPLKGLYLGEEWHRKNVILNLKKIGSSIKTFDLI